MHEVPSLQAQEHVGLQIISRPQDLQKINKSIPQNQRLHQQIAAMPVYKNLQSGHVMMNLSEQMTESSLRKLLEDLVDRVGSRKEALAKTNNSSYGSNGSSAHK